MKRVFWYLFCTAICISTLSAQTLEEARELYKKGEYSKALPAFEKEYKAKPTDALLNQWYGVCLIETGGDTALAEKSLLVASKRAIQDSFIYLGELYIAQYRFEEAKTMLDQYEEHLKKKKGQQDFSRLEAATKIRSRLSRMVSNTEDIQIIDSIVVDKATFLSAYKMSASSGRMDYFKSVFNTNMPVESTIYFNEKETKIYYAQPDSSKVYNLYSMEKLIKNFGNEKALSPTRFGLNGDLNYPFMAVDGVTIYFSAKDEESLGGYDLFVSRYNMNNDTYLVPERLNMPFNSEANDYLLVIDDEKGVGWFASDRSQPKGKVCVYTFIPNSTVKTIENADEKYLVSRALVKSIKDSWEKDKDYTKTIALARKAVKQDVKEIRDFEFVINDRYTYYTLNDFKNKIARDTYYKVMQLRNELKTLNLKLDNDRIIYNASRDESKRNMTQSILDMEKRTELMQKEIDQLEIEVRNQEIGMLK